MISNDISGYGRNKGVIINPSLQINSPQIKSGLSARTAADPKGRACNGVIVPITYLMHISLISTSLPTLTSNSVNSESCPSQKNLKKQMANTSTPSQKAISPFHPLDESLSSFAWTLVSILQPLSVFKKEMHMYNPKLVIENQVIRNAGGRAVDALRSVIISQQLLGTCEIVVIHHTDCGMLTFSNDDVVFV
jgi:hypothetical protein